MKEFLLEEQQLFNLEDFYINNEKVNCDGALGVITPKQNISILSPCEHRISAEKIYQFLYNNFKEFKISKEITYETDYNKWINEALDYGNIIILFCYGSYSIVYIPNTINTFQFSELVKLSEFIDKFNLNNYYMNFKTNLNDLDLKEILPLLKNRIDDNKEGFKEKFLINNVKQK